MLAEYTLPVPRARSSARKEPATTSVHGFHASAGANDEVETILAEWRRERGAAPAIELHLVRADEQVADLKARPRCAFEVDEVLAVIPSHWVHPEYAGSATAYHRTVIFECDAAISEDHGVLDFMVDLPGGGQRRQARPDAQEPGKDQANRAKHLAGADEVQERDREPGRHADPAP